MWTISLGFLVANGSDAENAATSIERVRNYIDDIPQEAAMETAPDRMPPKAWPAAGRLTMRKVAMRYREGQRLALRSLSCDVAPGERVGIVGRTPTPSTRRPIPATKAPQRSPMDTRLPP